MISETQRRTAPLGTALGIALLCSAAVSAPTASAQDGAASEDEAPPPAEGETPAPDSVSASPDFEARNPEAAPEEPPETDPLAEESLAELAALEPQPENDPSPEAEGESSAEDGRGLGVDLEWRWTRADIGNYVTVGIGAATAGTMIGLGAAGIRTPNRGGILFDNDARNAIRLERESQRLIARDISDGLLTFMFSAPLMLDALILGAWQHGDADLALELIVIHAEVLAVTLALQTTANIIASRERPYGQTCGGPGPDDFPEDSFFCNSPDRYYSFFSGHTSQTFASAAVVCSVHVNLPLLGGGPEEAIPCVTGFAVAATTGLLRMMSDMHYATDVITGAAVGTFVGFFLPWALHYAHGRSPESSEDEDELPEDERIATTPGLTVTLLPTGTGASVFGIW